MLNLSKGEENLCPLAYVQYIWSRVRYPIFWRTNTGYTIAAFYIMLLLLHQCLAVPDFYRSDTPGIFWYQNSKFIEIEMYFCNFKKRYTNITLLLYSILVKSPRWCCLFALCKPEVGFYWPEVWLTCLLLVLLQQ